MRAVVVYESMFGNTHEVAERIASGLAARYEVTVLPVGEAIAQILPDIDLLVVGAPTHVHGLSRQHFGADNAPDERVLQAHGEHGGSSTGEHNQEICRAKPRCPDVVVGSHP